MKSLFFLCVLISFFPANTFPQNVKADLKKADLKHADENSYFSTPTGELLPDFRSISSNEALKKFLLKRQQLKKLTGINANGRFEPVKVLIDSSSRSVSTYDSRGNRVSYTQEILNNGNWTIISKHTYTFDDRNNLITDSLESWADINSRSVSKSTFTYDNNGNVLSETRQMLQNSGWLNIYRTLNTYDNYGNCTTSVNASWVNGTWKDYSKLLYAYDRNNNMLTAAWQSLHGGIWTSDGRNTYSYDNHGNLVSILTETASAAGFVKTSMFSISYDQNDRRVKVSYEEWDHGVLRSSYEDAYTYAPTGKLLTYLGKQRIGNQLVDIQRKFYSYDNNGALISDLQQFWISGNWVNGDSLAYTYDSNGNAVKGKAFMWDNAWLPWYGQFDISYNNGLDHMTIAGITVNVEYEQVGDNAPALVQEFNLLQNYPNPFNSSTTIKYSIKKEGSVKITVFDILGNRVAVPVDKYKPAGIYYVNFDGSHLPSGVYIYSLESGGSTTTKKFILMK